MISKKDEKTIRKMLLLATDPDEAMTYDELCGFLFGLSMTPALVMPGEWLPLVFGEEMITVDSEEEANRLLKALMLVLNRFMERFYNKDLIFPFSENYLAQEDDLTTVQDWTYGLNEALSLRPDCWHDALPELMPEVYEEELMTSLSVIQGIAKPHEADKLFETHFDDEEDRSMQLIASLFVMLPAAVDKLLEHAAVLEEERRELLKDRPGYPPIIRRQSRKIGRNDPCPCGSGKKYKKCCLKKEKVVPIR